MKRNLIKGSAGNVSTTIKIRRINCFFLGSKRRAGGGGSGAVRGYKVQQREGGVGGKGTRGRGGGEGSKRQLR